MTRQVFACDDCGEEWTRDDETCPLCGGEVVRVDPVLVAALDAIEAIVASLPRPAAGVEG